MRRQLRADVAFVGEIEAGLDLGAGIEQNLAPGRDFLRHATGETRRRLLALRLGLGLNEIAKTLDFGQVELAVEESPAGELTSLGQPYAGQRGDRPEQRSNHRR